MTTDQTAILLCADGAPNDAELQSLSTVLQDHIPGTRVLAFGMGSGVAALAVELGRLAEEGIGRIVCLPAAIHASLGLKAAVPEGISLFSNDFPHVDVVFGRDIGIEPKLLRAGEQRLCATLDDCDADPAKSVLLIIAEGGETESNSDAAKFMRLMWEGMGFGWAELCYAHDSFPSVEQSLRRIRGLGLERVIGLPYALFKDTVSAAMTTASDAGCIVAEPIGLEQHIVAALADRFHHAIEGGEANAMNCQMCAFRDQVLGHDHAHPHEHEHDHKHEDT